MTFMHYLATGLLSLLVIYVGARLVCAAYFKSKADFLNQQQRKTPHGT